MGLLGPTLEQRNTLALERIAAALERIAECQTKRNQ